MRRAILAGAVLAVGLAAPAAPAAHADSALHNQAQADVGLAVVGIGYEIPIADHLALMAEGQIFGTYFLPWFDRGDDAKGGGAQLRATWFMEPSGAGLYIMAFGRMDGVQIDRDDLTANGIAVSTGIAAGWAFRLSDHIDLRVGAGVQYMYMNGITDGTTLGASTPFVTLDTVIGYRL
jgi:hypothetical protein